jgi:hypothetical protein
MLGEHRYEIQMLSRSTSTNRGVPSHTVSSGRVPGNKGRCKMASSGRSSGLGIATGNTLASLSSTQSKSSPSPGRNVASPMRYQCRRSSEMASAMRGPAAENAVYVMT